MDNAHVAVLYNADNMKFENADGGYDFPEYMLSHTHGQYNYIHTGGKLHCLNYFVKGYGKVKVYRFKKWYELTGGIRDEIKDILKIPHGDKCALTASRFFKAYCGNENEFEYHDDLYKIR